VGVVRCDVLRRDAGGAVYRWPYARRSPWRRAVAWLAVALMFVVMVAVWGVFLLHIAYWRTPTPEPVSWTCPAEWVVMPGDTLWRIAKTCWPEAHTGQMVHEIRRLNPGIDPGRLRVGQVLQLPVATEIAGGAE